MPASRQWNVWSVHVGESRALVVDEGTEAAAVESAGRRNLAAARHRMAGLVFMALPDGATPLAADAEAILIERDGAAPVAADPDAMAASWAPVMMDLVELDEAGALRGVRAVIAARLAMARNRKPDSLDGTVAKIEITAAGDDPEQLAEAAALLAAAIDRAAP